MYKVMHQYYSINFWRNKTSSFFAFVIIPLLLFTIQSTINAQSLNNLIFVKIPVQVNTESLIDNVNYSATDRYVKNARIVILHSSSDKPVNLTSEFYAACDPDVSFDGRSIIFAGKIDADSNWQIWQMNVDGTRKVQITHGEGDCITPVHAGNRFYLNDPQPTPQIIYAGTNQSLRKEQAVESVFALYGTDPEGKSVHRLTFNLYNDYNPDVLSNGRIVFTSWQQPGFQNMQDGKFVLLAINNDGTDLMPFYGNHTMPRYKDMVHVSDFDHRIYFIESERSVWLGGGDITYLSQRRPLQSYRKLSHSDSGLFHSPCPLPDNGLAASYRSDSPNSEFGLYLIDPGSGKIKEEIFIEPGWHTIDTQVLSTHPTVKGRSNWLIPGAETGVFYCLNSYRTNLTEFNDITPGMIKYVRVIEGFQHRASTDTGRRIVGIAPVENDGSFHVRVPAKTPLTFQLLDKNYMAIRSQNTWTWVMGNENRGCIGCHEDREMAPPNKLVEAVIKPPVDLTIAPEKRRMVDFRHQIEPLIALKCATSGCHISGQAKPNLENVRNAANEISSRRVYEVLYPSIQDSEKEHYVIPGNAKASPLIWHLFDKRLILDQTDYSSDIKLMPPGRPLNPEERISFIEWIDLGAQWDSGRAVKSDFGEDK
jgi:hypothetical protein